MKTLSVVIKCIQSRKCLRESSNVSLKVSFKKTCLHSCLEDTDCCAGSDVVWKCIPGLCCGYSEQSHYTVKELLLCPRSRPVSTTVTELDMESVIPVLSRHLFHSSIQTRVTAFRWVYNLFLKTPNKVALLQRLTLVSLPMFHYKCCFLLVFAETEDIYV